MACDARRQEVEVSQLGEECEDGHELVKATGVLPLMLGTLHDPQRDEHGPHTHAKGREVEEREELPIACDLGVREAIARGHADGQRDMVREATMLVEGEDEERVACFVFLCSKLLQHMCLPCIVSCALLWASVV
ncbi:hypothetical protein JB92DRAFT_2836185 [Gautieria morchelliformis]|nr:hypothetical protein JB92DRAFT_2836185 [Gautieria morchelliformis]